MKNELKILQRARDDAQHIFNYIQQRSPQGAANWWNAFFNAANQAASGVVQHGLAPENEYVPYPLQQVIFKTKQGRRYRFVFTIVVTELRILRVRGPGQPSLAPDELSSGDTPLG